MNSLSVCARAVSPRRVCGALLWCAVVFAAAAGGASDTPPAAVSDTGNAVPAIVRAAALNGPSSMPMAYLFEHAPELGGADAVFETAASPDVLLPRLLKGEIDIGVLPPNVAAKTYTAGGGAVLAAAVCGNGMLSVLSSDLSINSMDDLAGRRITVAGQGSTPDYLLRYLLAHAGVEAELDYSIPTAEIAAALAAGKIETACVPEPFATIACARSADIARVIDVQEAFAAADGGPYPMSLLVVRREFAQAYPDTVRAFLAAYREAIGWTNTHPEEAGALVEKHTLGLQAAVAAQAIPNAAFVYSDGTDMRESVETLLRVFLSFAPDSVGGVLPDAGFYFN